jgi:hypothetical protein
MDCWLCLSSFIVCCFGWISSPNCPLNTCPMG